MLQHSPVKNESLKKTSSINKINLFKFMKKKSFLVSPIWGDASKRFTIVCLMSFLFLSATSFGANNEQEQRISVHLKNAPITDVFKEIQSKTGFDFFYKNEQIPQNKKINVDKQNATVIEILEDVLKNTGLEYKIVDEDIVISPIPKKQEVKKKITGVVADAQGIPLPGVSVVVEGTTRGTVTDFDGNYEIDNVSDEQTLIFSFIGMTSQKLAIATSTDFNITLQDDTQGLEEVVVVGYGTMQRKQITSAVATFEPESLDKGATTTPVQMLQGKVAGLAISRPNGSDPNSSPQIMLRGIASLGNANPLIIVNGVEVGSLDIVSPEDIESFSVLKDGSAAAIYGSRGTNGVILITTKEGKEAKATVEYSGYYSFDQVSKRPDVLTADEFRALAAKRGVNVGTASTDWYDELLQRSSNMVHNVAISGGSSNTNYRASIEYGDNQGIALESYKKRVNGRVNINHKAIDNRLSVKVDLSANQSKYRAADYGAFGTALTMDPTQSVYEEDGLTYTKFPDFGKNNPVAAIKQNQIDNTHKILLANIYSDFRILDGLKVGGRMAWKVEDWNIGAYESRYSEGSIENDYKGTASREARFSYRSNYELNADYRKQFGLHEVSAMVNWSKESDTYETMSMWNKGFATDAFSYNSIEAGSWLKDEKKTPGMASYKKRNELESYRARLVYSYDEKYMFTLSFNREGSSKFGENNKWGNFKGLSLGWTLTKEEFMKAFPVVNYLKLRVGYGETGNSAAPEYQSLARIGQEGLSYLFRGETIVAYGLKNNPNPNLKWEEKAETNIGIDYAFWNNRLDGSIDAYQRKTTDLLYQIDAPLPANLNPTTLMNVGEIYNRGIEFTLNAKILSDQNFSWNASFNASYNSNEVKKLTIGLENSPQYFKQLPAPGNLGTVYRVEEGQPLGNFYSKRFVKIDENGQWVFKDLNNDGEIKDEDDREIVGNGTPKYFAGLTNSFQYKRFSLSVFFRGAFDYQILNVGRMYYENINKFSASNIYATTGQNGLVAGSQYSDYYLENGDYVKLENVSLSYDFDVSKIKFLSSARAYISCNNVFTITNYSGLSPEVSIAGLETAGYDGMDFYPITRTITIGASFKF